MTGLSRLSPYYDILPTNESRVTFLTNASVPKLSWFLTSVVPPIIFFVAFVQVLYYWYASPLCLQKFG
jgi:nucleoside permease NupC